MCFIHDDYDWRASIVEQSDRIAESPYRCDECQATIAAGEPVHHVYMQQYEECRDCENGECTCPPVIVNGETQDGCCMCSNPTFGETFDYDRCDGCSKFLHAIQLAEEDEGCSGDETRPGLGTMIDDMLNGGLDEAKRYFKRALLEYPELKTSGYLGRLGKRIYA